jgi:hypothetical protein
MSLILRVGIPAELAYRYTIPAGILDTGMIPVSCCHFWHHTRDARAMHQCAGEQAWEHLHGDICYKYNSGSGVCVNEGGKVVAGAQGRRGANVAEAAGRGTGVLGRGRRGGRSSKGAGTAAGAAAAGVARWSRWLRHCSGSGGGGSSGVSVEGRGCLGANSAAAIDSVQVACNVFSATRWMTFFCDQQSRAVAIFLLLVCSKNTFITAAQDSSQIV